MRVCSKLLHLPMVITFKLLALSEACIKSDTFKTHLSLSSSMAKHIKSILSILITAMALNAFCIPSRLSNMKLSPIKAERKELGLPKYDETELENDKYKDFEVGTKRENSMYEDLEAEKKLNKFWRPFYFPEIQRDPTEDNELLTYFYQSFANNNADGFTKLKRGGKFHKPDGRIRLLKTAL